MIGIPSYEEIDKFFNPESVAIIGASRKTWGASNSVISSLIYKKYPGKIYLINANANPDDKLYGMPLYKNVKEIPPVDLAFIIVPARFVKVVIEDCIEVGIKNAVIISAGFKESILYDEKKYVYEREIVNMARINNLRLVGPNCNGVINVPTNFYALFGPRLKLEPGDCSYVSRGGTAIGNILIRSALAGFGANKLINIGDEADLKVQDFIKYYDEDPTTKVIGVYTEGISNGSDLVKILKNVSKPVIFYKSGQTKAGMRAAISHVGAIASEKTNEIYKGFIRQTGVIPVNNIDEMVNIAMAFSLSPPPKGNRIGIFTYGGSLGVMMSDAAERNGLVVGKLSQEQIDELNKILPEYWSHNNPVDVTDGNQAYTPQNMVKIFKIILEEFDALFVVAPVFEDDSIFDIDQNEINFRKMYQQLVKDNIRKYKKIMEKLGKPIFVLGDRGEFSKIFIKNRIPVYPTFESMARSFSALYQYTQNREKKKNQQ
ncbi:MAG: acetate--CoA ligase family protein [Candidatus Helarchaeota archaeon]